MQFSIIDEAQWYMSERTKNEIFMRRYVPDDNENELSRHQLSLNENRIKPQTSTLYVIDQTPWHIKQITKNEIIFEKDINELSTHQLSLNENRKKIKYQHYDHIYVPTNLINDLVNDDCLAQIFTYIPVYERPKIALVCKKWNRALQYSWCNSKKLELSHWMRDDYRNIFYKNPKLDGGLKFLQSLFDKCGRYLTDLDLAAYSNSDIMPIVKESCPNLVKLRLLFWHIKSEHLENAFSHMSQLKILKFIFNAAYGIPDTFTISLMNVSDTLNELIIANWNTAKYTFTLPKMFATVLPRLNALQRFETWGVTMDYASFKSITFRHKVFYYRLDSWSSTIFWGLMLKNIQKLLLDKIRVTDDFLYNLANNTYQLEIFAADVNWVTDAGMKAISKLKKLHSLHMKSTRKNNNITDYYIKFLKNMRHLTLPFSDKITDDSVIKVLETSPDLYRLTISHTSVTYDFIKKAAEIVENRQQKLILLLDFDPNVFKKSEYETTYLTIGSYPPLRKEGPYHIT